MIIKEYLVVVKSIFLSIIILFSINSIRPIFPKKKDVKIIEKSIYERKGKEIQYRNEINNENEPLSDNTDLNDENLIMNKKNQEEEDIRRYNKLADFPKNPGDPLIKKERKTILELYYNGLKKNNIIIYFDMAFPFGNQIAAVNKMIFYCEIIQCKKLILPEENNIYINHTLYDKDYKMKIEICHSIDDYRDADFITSLSPEFYYNIYNLKIENRLDILKNEIVNNLPKVNINKDDLFIHIRSGDIFQNKNNLDYAPDYAQPPLCFYIKIIEKFQFNDIYIISSDDIYNPVIKELKIKFPKIIYHENALEKDIAYLVNGYNIVGSISSFLISSIKLNDNLKYLWEYDRYPMCSKMFHSHHSIYNIKRKYTIYQMEPSEIYKKEMIVWKGSDQQIQIMLNDTCPYDFKRVETNIT
jgi:hypothetical protein